MDENTSIEIKGTQLIKLSDNSTFEEFCQLLEFNPDLSKTFTFMDKKIYYHYRGCTPIHEAAVDYLNQQAGYYNCQLCNVLARWSD